MALTPGVIFLGRAFLSLLLPCSIIALVRYILGAHFGIFISLAYLVLAAVVLLPIAIVVRYGYGELYKRQRAAALGARVTPKLPGKYGNVDRLMQLLRGMDEGHCVEVQTSWLKEFGTVFNVNIFWEDMIFTVEPDHVKAILATEFPNYVKGEKFRFDMFAVLGTGVFNSDGDMWKFHRSMTRPFFTRDRISEFDNFERHADAIIKAIKERLKAGYAIDFQDAMHRFTLDSASEFLLGNDINSLGDSLPYPHNVRDSFPVTCSSAEAFAKAFAEAQFLVASRNMQGWSWPLMNIFEDKTKKPMQVVSAFVDPIVEEAVRKRKANPIVSGEKATEVEEGDTLLDHLVKLTTDRTVLKDEILNILIAARDTTAVTVTFTIYLLSQHPEVLARLHEEVLTHIGPSARPTHDSIRGMKFLRAVINETLRLFPAVPMDVRESIQECLWSSPDPAEKPFYIPAGTKIVYSSFMTHRRTDLWGPDALDFDPDRFLDDRLQKYLVPKPYIFLPFNAGPRICLGQQFAYNEMSFLIIRLLQNFTSFTLDPASQPPETVPPASWAGAPGRKGIERFWPQSHLTMYSKGGLWMKMGEA